MQIFIGGIWTETNSFSPVPTGDESFAAKLFQGNATEHPPLGMSLPLHTWRAKAQSDDIAVIEGICASAGSAGITSRRTYEKLRDELIDDLRRASPVDIVLLSLHGAMIAHEYDDCEGDILACVREVVGPAVIIGVEMDLHCNITTAMLKAADVLVTYKESPHTDQRERAEEVYAICLSAAKGEVIPCMVAYDCRMISAMPTIDEPMASFVRRMSRLESEDEVLSISLGHCFAFSDVPENGAKVVVITDNNETKAKQIAAQLGKELWDLREQTSRKWMDLDDVLDRVVASDQHPIVLSDFCDNPGGGAPSDSTYILQAILDRGISDVASGLYWDPMAVQFCIDAGEGSEIDLRIGGKCCAASGQPVDTAVVIKKIIANASLPRSDAIVSMGTAVRVQIRENIDLVLTTQRSQAYHPSAFSQLGINLSRKKVIVVKSSNHFRAEFEPIAAEILFPATNGLLTLDYRSIPYRKFNAPYWPKDENPFS